MKHEQHDRVRPDASEQTTEAARGATRADAVLHQRSRRATQPGILIGGVIAQAKLSVGSVDDRFEREADATASRVVRALRSGTPESDEAQTDTGPGVQRSTQPAPLVIDDRADAPGRISRIQRSAVVGAQGGDLDDDTTRLLNSSRGGGAPLPEPARSKMEGAFGADFSGVRVHSGATSTELNNRIQAKAFTTGNDIFFRDQVPDASTGSGQELLAHELTHTIQQGAGVQRELAKGAGSGVIHMDERGVGHDAPGSGVIHMDERGVGHDAPGSGVIHLDSRGVGHDSPFVDGATGVGEYIASPRSLSELATSAEVSHGVWAKDHDVLLNILLGPFEANWFKAKDCLTMGRWPLAGEHPKPSHEAGIRLMQALVVMRKAKWTEFITKVVKPGFQERMRMFGAIKEPLVDVPTATRGPQQQKNQMSQRVANAKAAEQTPSNDYDLQSDIDSSEAEKGKKLQEIFDSVGAEAVTSDVDLASGGSNSELGIQFVNERFRSQFVPNRVIPYDPGTVFDINVYASDWLHGDLGVTDSVGKGSAGEDSAGKATKVRTITPAKEVSETTETDELKRIRKMEVWSLVKVRRNMETDKEWDTYKDATLANLTDKAARAEMESKLSEANREYGDFAKKVEDRQAKMLASLTAQEAAFFGGGASAFGADGDHFAKDASFTRAANAIYEETLQTVKELRLRIERLRAAPVKNEKEISNVGVQLSSKIAEALTYANEVYATEGAVKHTVLKQGAGNKLKKLQAKPETADLTGLDYNLAPELYLQAVNENVGDSLHSIHHFHDMPRYAVYRAGKYLARLIDATQQLLPETAETAPSYDTLLEIGTQSVRVKKITNGRVEGDPERIEGDPKFVDDDSFFQKYTPKDLPLIRAQIIQFGAKIPKLFADKQQADKARAALAEAASKMPLEQS